MADRRRRRHSSRDRSSSPSRSSSRSESRSRKMPEYSLYVGDLTSDVDDYKLYYPFSKRYRSVHSAKVVVDSNGKSKGYGFVRFSDESEQQQALIEMQHTTGIGHRPIRVSLATNKRESRQSESTSSSHTPYYSSYPGYQAHYPWPGYTYPSYNPYVQPSPTPGTTPTPAVYPPQHDHQSYYDQGYDEDLEVLEDPGLEIDVEKENREFMESSESFFEALERSRWTPLDNVTSLLPGQEENHRKPN